MIIGHQTRGSGWLLATTGRTILLYLIIDPAAGGATFCTKRPAKVINIKRAA
jgi:hypothetical protein